MHDMCCNITVYIVYLCSILPAIPKTMKFREIKPSSSVKLPSQPAAGWNRIWSANAWCTRSVRVGGGTCRWFREKALLRSINKWNEYQGVPAIDIKSLHCWLLDTKEKDIKVLKLSWNCGCVSMSMLNNHILQSLQFDWDSKTMGSCFHSGYICKEGWGPSQPF